MEKGFLLDYSSFQIDSFKERIFGLIFLGFIQGLGGENKGNFFLPHPLIHPAIKHEILRDVTKYRTLHEI